MSDVVYTEYRFTVAPHGYTEFQWACDRNVTRAACGLRSRYTKVARQCCGTTANGTPCQRWVTLKDTRYESAEDRILCASHTPKEGR